MATITDQFTPFAERMRGEGLPNIVIRTFEHYYQQLVQGQTGLILRPIFNRSNPSPTSKLSRNGYRLLAKLPYQKRSS
jgi:hypothetical protein